MFNPALSHGHRLTIQYKPSEADIGSILSKISECGLTIKDLTTEEPDLEDAFLQMTSSKSS